MLSTPVVGACSQVVSYNHDSKWRHCHPDAQAGALVGTISLWGAVPIIHLGKLRLPFELRSPEPTCPPQTGAGSHLKVTVRPSGALGHLRTFLPSLETHGPPKTPGKHPRDLWWARGFRPRCGRCAGERTAVGPHTCGTHPEGRPVSLLAAPVSEPLRDTACQHPLSFLPRSHSEP